MENPIRTEFFRRTLHRSFADILSLQQDIASARGYDGLSALLAAVRPRVQADGASLQVEMDYPLHIRFLDMRHRQNLRIYNRPLWQGIYRDVVPELRHGFTDEVRQELRSQLQGLFPEAGAGK